LELAAHGPAGQYRLLDRRRARRPHGLPTNSTTLACPGNLLEDRLPELSEGSSLAAATAWYSKPPIIAQLSGTLLTGCEGHFRLIDIYELTFVMIETSGEMGEKRVVTGGFPLGFIQSSAWESRLATPDSVCFG